jgi:hypothetical protein
MDTSHTSNFALRHNCNIRSTVPLQDKSFIYFVRCVIGVSIPRTGLSGRDEVARVTWIFAAVCELWTMTSLTDEQYLQAQDLPPVVSFVRQGLTDKIGGKPSHYNHITSQLLKRNDPELLWRLYLALASNVSIIASR